ncbi:hypothetical protein [Segniliparus rotundus]|uniref:hypothetical protein n=1 Tax=Segniliparus rotundus TaxID=286802 RepID=UPI0011D15D55|nr:hypothetical protein [Segniliparus rotundus]
MKAQADFEKATTENTKNGRVQITKTANEALAKQSSAGGVFQKRGRDFCRRGLGAFTKGLDVGRILAGIVVADAVLAGGDAILTSEGER